LIVWECQLRDKEQLKNGIRLFLGDECGRSSFSREPGASESG
jgi:G:T-mismatch repair DNA endonuclease (very short patch repair protein)